MTDRELLELAAKAAGIEGYAREDGEIYAYGNPFNGKEWNPLIYDGDALRLESYLSLDVSWSPRGVAVGSCFELFECHGKNKNAARRIAGVRAAAEIGKGME